jgi:hypothetical protein
MTTLFEKEARTSSPPSADDHPVADHVESLLMLGPLVWVLYEANLIIVVHNTRRYRQARLSQEDQPARAALHW